MKVDGLISDKEYAFTVPLEKMTVVVTRSTDTLFLGLRAQTKGWVALGFGSDRMDGAHLFIATVTDGTASLSQQLGSGHSHKEVSDNLAIDYAIVEGSGRTTPGNRPKNERRDLRRANGAYDSRFLWQYR